MTLRLGALHDALLEPGDKALALKAAEEVADVLEARHELKADIADLRRELKGDIAGVRHELKADIADVRRELKADIADVRRDVTVVKWMLGTVTALCLGNLWLSFNILSRLPR